RHVAHVLVFPQVTSLPGPDQNPRTSAPGTRTVDLMDARRRAQGCRAGDVWWPDTGVHDHAMLTDRPVGPRFPTRNAEPAQSKSVGRAGSRWWAISVANCSRVVRAEDSWGSSSSAKKP